MFDGKSILITGGTGTFGAAMVEHLLGMDRGPRRVIVLSRDEYKQDRQRRALEAQHGDRARDTLRWFLGDVRDAERLSEAFRGVDYVVHAAALKQVPAAEYNPGEAIKTNVLGAVNVIHAAIERQVPRVVALSSDKACAPLNLYGATKLCMERAFMAAGSMGGGTDVRFAVTRYGNVAGSRGSVIPIWRAAAQQGIREVTVTDPECTRFWMQPVAAVDLVLWTLRHMSGGELVVPNLRAYRLGDLLEAMDLRGRVVGLRVGEKAHEAMVSEHEAPEFWCADLQGRYWIRRNDTVGSHLERMPRALTSDTVERIGVEELRYLVKVINPEEGA